jgi:hypothetical protein
MVGGRFGPFDPRNPWHVLFVTLLVLLLLGCIMWIWAAWQGSAVFRAH